MTETLLPNTSGIVHKEQQPLGCEISVNHRFISYVPYLFTLHVYDMFIDGHALMRMILQRTKLDSEETERRLIRSSRLVMRHRTLSALLSLPSHLT